MKKAQSQTGSDPDRDNSVRITLRLPVESYRQLEELANGLHITRTSVIAVAIGRWYHQEPVLAVASPAHKKKKKRRKQQHQSAPFDLGKRNHGSNSSGVSNG